MCTTGRLEICHVAVGALLTRAADRVSGVKRCKTHKTSRSLVCASLRGRAFVASPTQSLDPLARGAVADRLAVLAFIVAAVEPRHARAHGVLPSRAHLQDLLVAVWKKEGEAGLGGPRLLPKTLEDEG